MEGIEPRASKIWQDTANSEMRIWLLEELVKLGVGLNDIEAFNIGLINKLRSEEMKGKANRIKEGMVRETLKLKLKDEQRYHAEMNKRKSKVRGEVGKIHKPNSKPYRAFMKRMSVRSNEVKNEYRKKYQKKLTHLRRKHDMRKRRMEDEIPKEFKEFSGLSIFDEDKFDEIEVGVDEVLVVSKDVILSEDEKSVLRLHKKFSLVKVLEKRDFNFEMEQAFAKLRMERKKELEQDAKRKEAEEWLKDIESNETTGDAEKTEEE